MTTTLHTKLFSELTAAELYDIARLREEVFFLEQKVDCEELDGLDIQCTHLWAEQNGEVVGYLRILPAGLVYEEPSIGRLAVKKSARRNGIGRQLILLAMEWIERELGTTKIKISAQAYLTDFYSSLGFEIISELYLEGGINHYKMLKQ